MPLFSVIVPTRNRARLLPYAIRSVLSQEVTDYELIVCDNASSDETRLIVDRLNSPKIKYVNTGRLIPSSANWNFGFQAARGDYIVVLGDDDCMSPGLLRAFLRIVEDGCPGIVGCRHVWYYDGSYPEEHLRNTIHGSGFSGEVRQIETRTIVESYFHFTDLPYKPHPSAVCVSKQIADDISCRHGAFFLPPFPEFTALPLSLSYVGSMWFIDKPLVVAGRTALSWGPNALYFNPEGAWADHLLPERFIRPPLSGRYLSNGIVESLLRVKECSPDEFRNYAVPLEKYFGIYYREMLAQARLGYDIKMDFLEFRRAVSALPKPVRRKVKNILRIARVREMLRRTPLSKVTRMLRNTISRLRNAQSVIVRGDEVGVHDIYECAERLETISQRFNHQKR